MLSFASSLAILLALVFVLDRRTRRPLLTFTLLVAFHAAILAMTGRPVFALAAAAVPTAVLAWVSRFKRGMLDEELSFSDLTLIGQIFTHPRFYIAYVGEVRMAVGVLVIGAATVGLWLADPPLPPLSRLTAACLSILATLFGLALVRVPVLRDRATRGFSQVLAKDCARYGLLETLLAHALIFFRERPGFAARVAAAARLPTVPTAGGRRAVIVIQNESYFDPRRVLDDVPEAVVAPLDALRARGQWGPLTVSCFGANTMRTEMEVLTGTLAAELGVLAFNPYLCAANHPVDSLPRRFAAAGWRTACLHPYDPTFFARHKVMPQLGFDSFLGTADLSHLDKADRYCSDVALAEELATRAIAAAEPSFLFAITMENHGPWEMARSLRNVLASVPGLTEFAETHGFAAASYLYHMQSGARMIETLLDHLRRARMDATICLYGDHRPPLPFALGPDGDWSTDYLIVRTDAGLPCEDSVPLAPSALAAKIVAAAEYR